MDRYVFMDGLNEIFSFFGRKMPDNRICESIFRRVKELPPEFMAFAVRHFEDQESLPRNMGYYLSRILWPEYLEKNPGMRANEISCCPMCIPELPGWRRAWVEEMTGWGEKVYKPVDVRCTCGNARNPRNEAIMDDFELMANGFILENPYNGKYQSNPGSWRNGGWDKCIGLEPETNKAHNDHAEKYDEYEF